MIKIIFILLFILLCTINSFAYTIIVQMNDNIKTTYENVVTHKFTEDFLYMYILDGWQNQKVYVNIYKIKNIEVNYEN